ncbi:ubiE/COQ5 methyltransferase family-domain-containing protein [Podospora australis]|uniref:2-methoxy-6-polyprenyl-1,4-benzoquinol methylase, mitochondrial n=1 Tax=Podospora australis TaxID=1536484 RepID=A0AAN6WYZ9_9PEZI|nr:ubiE/COQ5 methyltransferase family-domain-containing protein [Podospora australis]
MATAAARQAMSRPSLLRIIPRPRQQQQLISLRFSSSSSATSSSPPKTPEYAIPDPSRPTHFGYETVTEAEKRKRVAGVFTSVAESYDRMNDLMSFGWHRIWKDHFVSTLNPGFSPLSGSSPSGPQHILDIAGGTGDIAFRMLHHAHVVNANPSVRVTISDINRAMLSVGKARATTDLPASQQEALSFVEANAENLSQTRPLQPILSETEQTFFDPATATSGIPDASVDLYTVAFGIRNFSNIPAALREAHRVLKPGGVFACLEFSKADKWTSIFESLYKEWSFRAIPLIGQLVAGDRDSYQYLVESIERFPSQEEFRDMIVDAGFVVAGKGYEDLTGGVAAIHRGMKPRK